MGFIAHFPEAIKVAIALDAELALKLGIKLIKNLNLCALSAFSYALLHLGPELSNKLLLRNSPSTHIFIVLNVCRVYMLPLLLLSLRLM